MKVQEKRVAREEGICYNKDMQESILIIEDEKDIVKMLEYNLQKEGFKIISSSDGESGFSLAVRRQPALILLDVMLPGMNGLEMCKALKKEEKTARIPVIMVTAKSRESDKIVGLELGADDYITKPFSIRELTARIKAVLRRTGDKEAFPEMFTSGELRVDFSRIQAALKGRPVSLTAKEFELLKALIKAKGRVLSRDYLLDAIWGFENALEIRTRTVDVHIRTLRKKLGKAGRRIVTVKNYGYRFEPC
ncbi:MAG: response regulator transcription factor [Candidatus Omnitrophica bacterium]|nr:response regulator transcription factor [Candidatus Omnitrophota bacterium]